MSLAMLQHAMSARLWETSGAHDVSPLIGIPEERLDLYESLLLGTIQETLTAIYPLCAFLLDEELLSLAESFRRQYPNRTYTVHQAVAKFPEFLATQTDWMLQWPFLAELARYEYAEVVALNCLDCEEPSFSSLPQNPEAFSTWEPVWNRASVLESYTYAMPRLVQQLADAVSEQDRHLLAKDRLIVMMQPTVILSYRDPDTYQARHVEVNSLTVSLMAKSGSYKSALDSLRLTEPLLQSVDLETVYIQGIQLFQTCLAQRMLLGSKPVS